VDVSWEEPSLIGYLALALLLVFVVGGVVRRVQRRRLRSR
jgi:hypothetical protein